MYHEMAAGVKVVTSGTGTTFMGGLMMSYGWYQVQAGLKLM